jgi:hypothetical protein
MFYEMIKPVRKGWRRNVPCPTVKLKLRDASHSLETRLLGGFNDVISALNLRHTAVNKQLYSVDKTGGI